MAISPRIPTPEERYYETDIRDEEPGLLVAIVFFVIVIPLAWIFDKGESIKSRLKGKGR